MPAVIVWARLVARLVVLHLHAGKIGHVGGLTTNPRKSWIVISTSSVHVSDRDTSPAWVTFDQPVADMSIRLQPQMFRKTRSGQLKRGTRHVAV